MSAPLANSDALQAADTATGVTLPAQQLVGFARVELEPGESKPATFTVPMSLLAYTGLSGELVTARFAGAGTPANDSAHRDNGGDEPCLAR